MVLVVAGGGACLRRGRWFALSSERLGCMFVVVLGHDFSPDRENLTDRKTNVHRSSAQRSSWLVTNAPDMRTRGPEHPRLRQIRSLYYLRVGWPAGGLPLPRAGAGGAPPTAI